MKKAKPQGLKAGMVPAQQFELLLAGTSIRSEPLIAALRDHLVEGVMAKVACEKHEVNHGLFSRRLLVLQEEDARARQLSEFYQKG